MFAEKDADVEDESWPAQGRVEFKGVTLAYDKNLDPVLINASFVVSPGEKVRSDRVLGHFISLWKLIKEVVIG